MSQLPNLETHTLADGVENTLLQYMRKSQIAPGDLLPKEEELAENLNVSRHIVREGISRLKGLDLIESRQRRGMVMKRPNAFVSLNKFVQAKLLQEQDYKDMLELRVALELGMCDMIYFRKTDRALKELFALAGDGHASQYDQRTEVNFHSKLFSICGNRMALQFRDILVSSFKPIYANLSITDARTPSHLEICQTLQDGTAEDFHDIMHRHLERYFDLYGK